MFSIHDYFNAPAILIKSFQNQTTIDKFHNDSIEFKYNSYGYRTHEFDQVQKNYILIAGCSLTEGHGLHLDQTWAYKLEQQANMQIINLAKGGANAEFVGQNLANWICSKVHAPQAVIAQWPNPFRQLHWKDSKAQFVINSNYDELFKYKLVNGKEYFYLPWVKSIITLNQLCRSKQIPVLNVCFETPETVKFVDTILESYGINLHLDLKMPNETWHFDSSAADGCHHSEWCTQQWTDRILGLLKILLKEYNE